MAVFGLTCLCFLPSLGNGFLDRDDRLSLFENPYFRGLGWAQLRWMFTTTHPFGNYEPLNWLVYGLTYLIWGLDPAGYHLTGLFIHAAAALAFYFVTKRLLRLALPAPSSDEDGLRLGAAFAALVFSAHPLRVETVAWVSAQHYSLSAVFYLLSIGAYLRARDGRDSAHARRWRWAALGAFVLSLLSYSVAMTLPLVLLILDAYPLRRLDFSRGWGRRLREAVWEKAGFFAAAAAAGVVQVFARRAARALLSIEGYPLDLRLAETVYGLAFYLRKTLWPVRLLPFYRIPRHFDALSAAFVMSAVAVLLGAAGLLAARRRWPAGLAVAACYAVGLLPVLGIVQAGLQLVADRYSYLPCLSWAALAGAALSLAWRRPGLRGWALTLSAGLIAALGGLTWGQIGIWKDDLRLWEYTLSLDPERPDLHYDLAYSLARRGRLDEAARHYREAIRLGEDSRARVNLGNVLLALRRPGEAALEFEEVLRSHPRNIPSRYDLGLALLSQGKISDALAQYRELLKIEPGDIRARAMVGALEKSLGRPPRR